MVTWRPTCRNGVCVGISSVQANNSTWNVINGILIKKTLAEIFSSNLWWSYQGKAKNKLLDRPRNAQASIWLLGLRCHSLPGSIGFAGFEVTWILQNIERDFYCSIFLRKYFYFQKNCTCYSILLQFDIHTTQIFFTVVLIEEYRTLHGSILVKHMIPASQNFGQCYKGETIRNL